ncbi:hypothetical protein [Micromonospora sp. NPDC048839]|uniref:deoxynucleotide monophosphate kinase family protein n=1 Tax=Micromonospora sp. NPDC048839 TaxID=3155641 RepID=UPI0033E01BBC
MTRPLVGVLGRKRAGKTTFADRFVERHGYVSYAFGDPVKTALLALDPIIGYEERFEELDPRNHWYEPVRLSEVVNQLGWEKAKELPEVRALLQRFATESIRALDEDFWVRLVMSDVDSDIRPVVIGDVRFHNEAEAIRRAGGLLVRVTRPGLPPDPHISENGLIDRATDYEIHNDAGLDFLTSQTDWLAGLINRRYGK